MYAYEIWSTALLNNSLGGMFQHFSRFTIFITFLMSENLYFFTEAYTAKMLPMLPTSAYFRSIICDPDTVIKFGMPFLITIL